MIDLLIYLIICFQLSVKTNIRIASDGPKVANVAETGNSWSRSVGKVVLIVVGNASNFLFRHGKMR